MTLEELEQERQSIDRDLVAEDEEIRRLAVERVSTLPVGEAIPRLVSTLGDGSWRVRKAAVDRLSKCSDHDHVEPALIDALADGENPGRRNSAFEAIVACGARMTARLVANLSSDDVDVRKLLVDAIAAIGDPAASGAMLDRLSDPDPNVRAAAAEAAGVIGGEGAAERLLEVACQEDQDPLVRLSSLRGLDNLSADLSATELGSCPEDPVLRPAAFKLLGHASDEASIDVLLKGLSLSARASREAAMHALLRIYGRTDGADSDTLRARIADAARAAESLVPAAIERLPDASLSDRLTLIQFLGLVADVRTVVPILEAGRDEALAEVAHTTLESFGALVPAAIEQAWPDLGVELRCDACEFLGRSFDEVARGLLFSALDDANAELRAAAARALGQARAEDALAPLVRHLEAAAVADDPDAEDEVGAIAQALIDIGSVPAGEVPGAMTAAVVDTLAARLDGAEEPVRLAIAHVLGRVGRHEDAELVAFLLKDPSASVRRAAVEALARLEPGAASEPLRLALADESAQVRIAAAGALGSSDRGEVIDDLQRLLHDEEQRVSAAAVRAIGAHALKDESRVAHAVTLIEYALEGDPMTALAAIETLSALGGEAAANAALKVLDRDEPEIVRAAVSCVGQNASLSSMSDLIALLSHADWSVRAEVVQILADRNVKSATPAILRRLEVEHDTFVRDGILRALKQLGE